MSQQKLQIYEKIAIIIQIWHRAKPYVTRISSLYQLMMVPSMKKIHPAIMEKCERTNIWWDWRTDELDLFLYSLILLKLKQSRE